jgi:hypothetical protein
MCWVNSNLARNNELTIEQLEVVLKTARAGVFTEDPAILSDCLWTLSYITMTNSDQQIDHIS